MRQPTGNRTGKCSASSDQALVADDDQVSIDGVGDGHQHRHRIPDRGVFDHPHAVSFAGVVTELRRSSCGRA